MRIVLANHLVQQPRKPLKYGKNGDGVVDAFK